MSKPKFFIIFLTLFSTFATAIFAFVNIGIGYGIINNSWIVRIGYEDSMFSLNGNYFVNLEWCIDGSISFETPLGVSTGPMLGIINDLRDNKIYMNYGGFLGYRYKGLFDIKLAFLMEYSSSLRVSDSLFASFRTYVPDPSGMKMKDKLYVEINYFKQRFYIVVGLLEPF